MRYKHFHAFLNPRIVEASNETILAWEGSISNLDELVLLERPAQVKVKFNLIDSKEIEFICDGLVSRIF